MKVHGVLQISRQLKSRAPSQAQPRVDSGVRPRILRTSPSGSKEGAPVRLPVQMAVLFDSPYADHLVGVLREKVEKVDAFAGITGLNRFLQGNPDTAGVLIDASWTLDQRHLLLLRQEIVDKFPGVRISLFELAGVERGKKVRIGDREVPVFSGASGAQALADSFVSLLRN